MHLCMWNNTRNFTDTRGKLQQYYFLDDKKIQAHMQKFEQFCFHQLFIFCSHRNNRNNLTSALGFCLDVKHVVYAIYVVRFFRRCSTCRPVIDTTILIMFTISYLKTVHGSSRWMTFSIFQFLNFPLLASPMWSSAVAAAWTAAVGWRFSALFSRSSIFILSLIDWIFYAWQNAF